MNKVGMNRDQVGNEYSRFGGGEKPETLQIHTPGAEFFYVDK